MLTSKSVKDCRLKADEPILVRCPTRVGVTGGYVDLSDVIVYGRRPKGVKGAAPKAHKGKARRAALKGRTGTHPNAAAAPSGPTLDSISRNLYCL